MDTKSHEGYNIFVLQLVAKGGITADIIFNYKVLPQVTTELCYKQSQVRLKNCIGVYHQWADNRLDLYVWYAWRGWCGWWVSHSDTYICMYIQSHQHTGVHQVSLLSRMHWTIKH